MSNTLLPATPAKRRLLWLPFAIAGAMALAALMMGFRYNNLQHEYIFVYEKGRMVRGYNPKPEIFQTDPQTADEYRTMLKEHRYADLVRDFGGEASNVWEVREINAVKDRIAQTRIIAVSFGALALVPAVMGLLLLPRGGRLPVIEGLPPDLVREIVAALIPFFPDVPNRTAFLQDALGAVPPDVDLTGSPQTFAANLVGYLGRYGNLSEAKPALVAALEAVGRRGGQDKREEINTIIAHVTGAMRDG